MKIPVVIGTFCIGIHSFANILTLGELKKSFTRVEGEYTKAWDRAAQMKVLFVVPTGQIDQAACANVKREIEAKYTHSPFLLTFQNGSSHFEICNAFEKFYFQTVALKNQFDLPIRYALQIRRNSHNAALTTLFLDSSYRIVEISHITSRSVLAERDPIHAHVTSVDGRGNVYTSDYQPTAQPRPWLKQTYSSADGMIGAAFRLVRPRRSDKGKEIVEIKAFVRAAEKDWDVFTLLPTYAQLFGGFYTYSNTLFRSPSSYHWLIEYFVGKKQVCSQGHIWKDKKVAMSFKAEGEGEFGNCGNSW